MYINELFKFELTSFPFFESQLNRVVFAANGSNVDLKSQKAQ